MEKNGAVVSLPKISLRKPVMGGDGEEVSELTFREPTGADIEKVGNPVSVDFSQDPPKISYEKPMSAMIAALAEVPPSTVKLMNARDWENAALLITNFFLPDLSRITS